LRGKVHDLRKGTSVAARWGSYPKNFLFLFVSSRFRKSTSLTGTYVARHHCGLFASGRASANKVSYFSQYKTASGCCTRQHKGVLAVRTNHFWRSVATLRAHASATLALPARLRYTRLPTSAATRQPHPCWPRHRTYDGPVRALTQPDYYVTKIPLHTFREK
jgi:hypothetical protein